MECSDDLQYCCESFKLYDLKSIKEIGKGAFSTIYSAEAYYNSTKVENIVIKKIKCKIEDFPIMADEGKTAIYMSNNNIGPEVYCTFYKTYKKTVVQYIIMKRMDFDAKVALESETILTQNKIKIANDMVKLVKLITYKHGKYFTDIKPNNFMVSEDYTVKMIDFDNRFHFTKKLKDIDAFYYNNIVYLYCEIPDKYSKDIKRDLSNYIIKNIGPFYIEFSSFKTRSRTLVHDGKFLSINSFYYLLEKLNLDSQNLLKELNEYLFLHCNKKLRPFEDPTDVTKVIPLFKYMINKSKNNGDISLLYKQIMLLCNLVRNQTLDKVYKDYSKFDLLVYSSNAYSGENLDTNIFRRYTYLEPTIYEIYILLKYIYDIDNIHIQDVLLKINLHIDLMIKYRPYDIVCTIMSFYTDKSFGVPYIKIQDPVLDYISHY